eukprot:TRINITY_DN11704_c0_g3_i1.p1 TRINITY_DN11704_c0_g3~~TRINITY_DN11704_c0_g3_i1.p1  ORF type:complete len:968 (+),score=261.75 TRINITY_DN11704_c0_g3_i1:156-3059(+)
MDDPLPSSLQIDAEHDGYNEFAQQDSANDLAPMAAHQSNNDDVLFNDDAIVANPRPSYFSVANSTSQRTSTPSDNAANALEQQLNASRDQVAPAIMEEPEEEAAIMETALDPSPPLPDQPPRPSVGWEPPVNDANELYLDMFKKETELLRKTAQQEEKEARAELRKPLKQRMAAIKLERERIREEAELQRKEDQQYKTAMRAAAQQTLRRNSSLGGGLGGRRLSLTLARGLSLGRRDSATYDVDPSAHDQYCPNDWHYNVEGGKCLHFPKSIRNVVAKLDSDSIELKVKAVEKVAQREKIKFKEPKNKGHDHGTLFDEEKVARSRLGAAERMENRRQARHQRYRTGYTTDKYGRKVEMLLYERIATYLAVQWDRVDDTFYAYLGLFVPFNGVLRKVESRFGNVITQYFELVRWVMLHNVLLFLFWLALVVLPQIFSGFPLESGAILPEDFFTGSNSFLNTSLYIGSYSNTDVQYETIQWNMPAAYLFTAIGTLVISGLLIFRRMNQQQAASTERVQDYRFSNAVFASWDFNITDRESKENRRVGAQTVLYDLLEDARVDTAKLTKWGRIALFLQRAFITLFLFGLIAAFSYGLLLLANAYQSSADFWEQLAAPLTASAGSSLLPNAFYFLGAKEKYDKATSIKLLVLRSYLIRIVAIYTIISAAFRNSREKILSDGSISTCWETNVGQELYNLALVNALFTAVSTLCGDLGRYVLNENSKNARALHDCKPGEVSKITGDVRTATLSEKIQGVCGLPTFQMGKSVMDLLYNQALVWMSMYFSPLAAAVGIATSAVLFGIKVLSLMSLLVPFDTRYRQARDDTFTLFLLLITLLISFSITGYVMLYFEPSTHCTPFQGQQTAWEQVEILLAQAPNWLNQALDFFTKATFIVPLMLALGLISFHKFNMLAHTQAVGQDLQEKYDRMLEQKRAINKQRASKRRRRRRKQQETSEAQMQHADLDLDPVVKPA